MKIIMDAMGGDYAPVEIVNGALRGIEELGLEIILVGKGEEILKVLEKQGIGELPKGLEIANAEDVVSMDDDPVTVVKERKNSSMVVGLTMLRDGAGDAFISAGSTGALISAATLIVKRIRGIRRAALGIEFPTAELGVNTLLLDCGANAECTPEYLLQFAYMGAFYMQRQHGIREARVALLNIGEEETKGVPLQRETYALLKKAHAEGRLKFTGNLEARDMQSGKADVVVADGYSGNMVLKTAEGIAGYMIDNIKDIFLKNSRTKLAALLVKPGLRELKKRMDYKEIGGTPLLGISKPVIKAHGSSDAKAIFNALRQAKSTVENGIIEDIINNIEFMKLKRDGEGDE